MKSAWAGTTESVSQARAVSMGKVNVGLIVTDEKATASFEIRVVVGVWASCARQIRYAVEGLVSILTLAGLQIRAG